MQPLFYDLVKRKTSSVMSKSLLKKVDTHRKEFIETHNCRRRPVSINSVMNSIFPFWTKNVFFHPFKVNLNQCKMDQNGDKMDQFWGNLSKKWIKNRVKWINIMVKWSLSSFGVNGSKLIVKWIKIQNYISNKLCSQ